MAEKSSGSLFYIFSNAKRHLFLTPQKIGEGNLYIILVWKINLFKFYKTSIRFLTSIYFRGDRHQDEKSRFSSRKTEISRILPKDVVVQEKRYSLLPRKTQTAYRKSILQMELADLKDMNSYFQRCRAKNKKICGRSNWPATGKHYI